MTLKMGKGTVQARFHLLGTNLMLAACLMTLVATANCADDVDDALLLIFGNRDWIERGLDVFCWIIGQSTWVTFGHFRFRREYSGKERALFVTALIFLWLSVTSLIIGCCCCMQKKRTTTAASISPPNHVRDNNMKY